MGRCSPSPISTAVDTVAAWFFCAGCWLKLPTSQHQVSRKWTQLMKSWNLYRRMQRQSLQKQPAHRSGRFGQRFAKLPCVGRWFWFCQAGMGQVWPNVGLRDQMISDGFRLKDYRFLGYRFRDRPSGWLAFWKCSSCRVGWNLWSVSRSLTLQQHLWNGKRGLSSQTQGALMVREFPHLLYFPNWGSYTYCSFYSNTIQHRSTVTVHADGWRMISPIIPRIHLIDGIG